MKKDFPPCIPPFWAKGGHLQTILGTLLPHKKLEKYDKTFEVPLESADERLHVSMVDGDEKVVLYLFHGLGGSVDSPYMQRFSLLGKRLGFKVMLTNHRGCGQGVMLSKNPYHSGRSEDLSKVIEFGKNLYPDHKHIAIGVSLSANALLLLCAGVRAKVKPDYAIAINAPINLTDASFRLGFGLNRIYDKHFTNELTRYLKNNAYELNGKKFKTIYEFDDIYTAPLGGFKNRDHYYETCSAKQYLKDIDIPTLIITSKDDPFVKVDEYLNADFSNSTEVHIEESGGHVGYIAKRGRGYYFWLDEVLERWFRVTFY